MSIMIFKKGYNSRDKGAQLFPNFVRITGKIEYAKSE